MPDREPLLLLRVCTLPVESLTLLAAERARAALTDVLAHEAELDRRSETLADSLHQEAGPALADDSAAARARHALLRLRRAVHNRRVLEPDALAIAEPRLSPAIAAALAEWECTRAAIDSTRARFRAVFAEERERAWSALSEWAHDARFQEGLRLVSGSLLSKVERLVDTPPCDWGHRERHAALKALAYLARFATKTSPNGVFCATAFAAWGDRADSQGENRTSRLVYLLNVAEARKVTACLATRPEVERAIVPRANPSLRSASGTWTFWKPASPRHPDDDEVLTRMRENAVAQAFLDEAGHGPCVRSLLERVGARCGFALGSPELRGFFDRLVAHGLLIAEVEVPYRCSRPLRELASAAAGSATPPAWASAVEAIEAGVDRLAAEPWPTRRQELDRIERELEALPHRRRLSRDDLFKVDAATELAVTLPRSVIAELQSFLHGYARLYAALYPEALFRAAYARRFLERFPPDVEVEALELYHGVFEPHDLARPWGFPVPPGTGSIADACTRAFLRVREVLADAARAAEAEGRDEIALESLDWDTLLGTAPDLHWSCGVLFQVEAASLADVSAGRFRPIVSAIYPGAGLASARLAHLHAQDGADPITDELRRTWTSLTRDDVVVAEITYMHGGRTANAGLRPTVVSREIELPGDRCSPGVEVYPLRDLTVRYDGSRERFVLRSRTRGHELRPILSSGISPEGFVSFLLAIGRQDLQPLGYFPGFEVAGVRRWPRMRWGQVVAFRRRWDVPASELRSLRAGRDPAAAFEHVERWRTREGIPRRVFVSSSREPKPFFVDLGSPPFLELLDHHALGATTAPDETIHLTEMLPGPDQSWVADARGRYASEFLVHLGSVANEGGA